MHMHAYFKPTVLAAPDQGLEWVGDCLLEAARQLGDSGTTCARTRREARRLSPAAGGKRRPLLFLFDSGSLTLLDQHPCLQTGSVVPQRLALSDPGQRRGRHFSKRLGPSGARTDFHADPRSSNRWRVVQQRAVLPPGSFVVAQQTQHTAPLPPAQQALCRAIWLLTRGNL